MTELPHEQRSSADGEHNPLYASKLRRLAERLGLPADYVSSIQ